MRDEIHTPVRIGMRARLLFCGMSLFNDARMFGSCLRPDAAGLAGGHDRFSQATISEDMKLLYKEFDSASQEILDQMNKPVNGFAPKQLAAKTGRQQSTNIYALETTNRTKKVADYSKYFQSSSDEEDDYDSEGDNRRGGVSGRSQRAANRDKKKAPSEESDGDAEISGEEEEESNEAEQEEASGSSDDESEKLTRNRRRGHRSRA